MCSFQPSFIALSLIDKILKIYFEKHIFCPKTTWCILCMSFLSLTIEFTCAAVYINLIKSFYHEYIKFEKYISENGNFTPKTQFFCPKTTWCILCMSFLSLTIEFTCAAVYINLIKSFYHEYIKFEKYISENGNFTPK